MRSTTYSTVLFDLDGTLTDPKVGITKSVQYALLKYGIEEKNPDDLAKFIGPPLLDSFVEYYSFDEKNARTAIEYYREYFSQYGIFENELYPKIPELLCKLKDLNKELFIATSKPTIFAERILVHFDINKYFTGIVGSNLDGTRCAKGEVINFVLSNFSENNSQHSIMVGDRKHDIIGAKENNLDSIGITYGYGSVEEIKNAQPTYIIHSVKDLMHWFEEVR